MAKGVRVKNTGNANNQPSNNGGIMGSGIFGMFGTTVRCEANDNSLFCSLSKFVNVIIMIIFLITIFYLIYLAFSYFSSGGKMRGGRKWGKG